MAHCETTVSEETASRDDGEAVKRKPRIQFIASAGLALAQPSKTLVTDVCILICTCVYAFVIK